MTIDDGWLAGFAARHPIRRVAAFGSVPRPDVRADSDIASSPVRGRRSRVAMAMEFELSALLGHEVGLRADGDVSPYLRDEVRSAAKELDAA